MTTKNRVPRKPADVSITSSHTYILRLHIIFNHTQKETFHTKAARLTQSALESHCHPLHYCPQILFADLLLYVEVTGSISGNAWLHRRIGPGFWWKHHRLDRTSATLHGTHFLFIHIHISFYLSVMSYHTMIRTSSGPSLPRKNAC